MARKRAYKWVALSILLIVGLPVGCVVLTVVRVGWALHKDFTQLNADSAAMQQPANYKPVELYLARLMQSDPALRKSDDGDPPDWLPPDLGKLDLHEFSASFDSCDIGVGGGLDDFFGYELNRAPTTSTGVPSSLFTLRYRGAGKDLLLDQFTFPASNHIEEEEFVKLALVELARRQAAFANGSQPILYGDDPVADRKRLLAQHPAIAAKLGYSVPAAAPSTSPFSMQLQSAK